VLTPFVANRSLRKLNMEIYIQRENGDPVALSRETILDYLRRGVVQASALAWHEGMSEWRQLGEIFGHVPSGDSATPAFTFAVPLFVPGPTPSERPIKRNPMINRPTTQPPAPQKSSGAMIALNLVLIAVVIAVAYFRLGSGGEAFHRFLATIQGPADAGAADQQTSVQAPPVAVTPLQPVQAVQPAPAAKPFDPAAFAANPAAWPKTVALRQQATFPAISNSQGVGSVNLPAGTVVNLVGIEGGLLDLEYQGGRRKFTWRLTDLPDRVAAMAPVSRVVAMAR
jgi:hypothetical protein